MMNDRYADKHLTPFCSVLYAAQYPCVFNQENELFSAIADTFTAIQTASKRHLTQAIAMPTTASAPSHGLHAPSSTVENT